MNIVMNHKPGLNKFSKLPDDGDPWVPNNFEKREKNTSRTPVGQATDKRLRPLPIKMNSFKNVTFSDSISDLTYSEFAALLQQKFLIMLPNNIG